MGVSIHVGGCLGACMCTHTFMYNLFIHIFSCEFILEPSSPPL